MICKMNGKNTWFIQYSNTANEKENLPAKVGFLASNK